jgi:TolB-like protein
VIKTILVAYLGVLMFSGCTGTQNYMDISKVDSGLKTEHEMVETNQDKIKKVDDDVVKAKLAVEKDAKLNSILTMSPTLESTISSIALQLLRNKKIDEAKSIIVTSFVRLDNLKKTTEFGRILSESLIHELSIRGFNVTEFRGQLHVSVNENGEYYITRDLNKINPDVGNTHVVVGTYSRQYKKVMLNVRVINNSNGAILSTARATYVHGLRDDCAIFKDCKPLKKIRITEER